MSVELQQLRKRYVAPDGSSVPVIDVAHFILGDGEQAALVGTSGSGKTTLLHLIAGILTPDSGRILFDLRGTGAFPPPVADAPSVESTLAYRPARVTHAEGIVDVTQISEAGRDVFRGRYLGYIFQTHHLLPGFTALENVLLGMSFTGRKHDRSWAEHLLREVGLSERLDYKPAKLSVGQQQRVAVARALANRPKVVLADEPTGALDANNAKQVMELIRKLCDEVKASLLVVSHDPEMTKQFQRVVTLADWNRAAAPQAVAT